MSTVKKSLLICYAVFSAALILKGLHVALQVVPPDASQGNVGRIFYCHVPNWVAMSFCFFANLAASITYLLFRIRRRRVALLADAVAVSTAEVGLVFCSLGLVTGSIWGRAVWGIWWTWDARLTATLVLWLMYLSYLVLRKRTTIDQGRTVSAVLAIFAYCNVPVVYMTTRWWRTQHPGPVFFGGPDAGLDPRMQPAATWNIWAWLAWGLLLVGIRLATWNIWAWLAWGLLLVGIRLATELRRQSVTENEAAHAIEDGVAVEG